MDDCFVVIRDKDILLQQIADELCVAACERIVHCCNYISGNPTFECASCDGSCILKADTYSFLPKWVKYLLRMSATVAESGGSKDDVFCDIHDLYCRFSREEKRIEVECEKPFLSSIIN